MQNTWTRRYWRTFMTHCFSHIWSVTSISGATTMKYVKSLAGAQKWFTKWFQWWGSLNMWIEWRSWSYFPCSTRVQKDRVEIYKITSGTDRAVRFGGSMICKINQEWRGKIFWYIIVQHLYCTVPVNNGKKSTLAFKRELKKYLNGWWASILNLNKLERWYDLSNPKGLTLKNSVIIQNLFHLF